MDPLLVGKTLGSLKFHSRPHSQRRSEKRVSLFHKIQFLIIFNKKLQKFCHFLEDASTRQCSQQHSSSLPHSFIIHLIWPHIGFESLCWMNYMSAHCRYSHLALFAIGFYPTFVPLFYACLLATLGPPPTPARCPDFGILLNSPLLTTPMHRISLEFLSLPY